MMRNRGRPDTRLALAAALFTAGAVVAYVVRTALEASGVLTAEQTYGWQLFVELPMCCGCAPLGAVLTVVFAARARAAGQARRE